MKYLDNNVDRGAKGALLISTIGLPPVVSKTVYTLTDFIITNKTKCNCIQHIFDRLCS